MCVHVADKQLLQGSLKVFGYTVIWLDTYKKQLDKCMQRLHKYLQHAHSEYITDIVTAFNHWLYDLNLKPTPLTSDASTASLVASAPVE